MSDKVKLSDSAYKKIMRRNKRIIKTHLDAYYRSYDSLVAAAIEHEAEQPKGTTAFLRFLDDENADETPQQHEDRIVANYLRHVTTNYDEISREMHDKFKLPWNFSYIWWNSTMNAIVDKYPNLHEAKVRGSEQKKRWVYDAELRKKYTENQESKETS